MKNIKETSKRTVEDNVVVAVKGAYNAVVVGVAAAAAVGVHRAATAGADAGLGKIRILLHSLAAVAVVGYVDDLGCLVAVAVAVDVAVMAVVGSDRC